MPQIALNYDQLQKVIQSAPATLRAVTRGDIDVTLAVANLFVTGMKESIRAPKSGKIYTTEFRTIFIRGASRSGVALLQPIPIGKSRPPHQASAPGEPPASDTGNLINALGVEIIRVTQEATTAGVGINATAPYWRHLEDGTLWMEPRPFVRPAYESGKAEALTQMIRKYRAATKRKLQKRRGTRIGG